MSKIRIIIEIDEDHNINVSKEIPMGGQSINAGEQKVYTERSYTGSADYQVNWKAPVDENDLSTYDHLCAKNTGLPRCMNPICDCDATYVPHNPSHNID